MDVSRVYGSGDGSMLRTVSAVIPALNEGQNIEWVLTRLPDCVDEVVVVDGRSTDDTIEVARRIRPDARIVHEMRPGKGVALRSGFEHSRGDYVVMLDADGSMEPAEVTRYVAMLDEGFDLVKGSRFIDGGGTTDISRLRALGNFSLLALANRAYGCRFTELCYGYMVLRRSAIPRLGLDADGFEIETQIVVHAVKAGLRIAEVASFEAPRRTGESNLRTFRDGGRVLRELLRARSRDLEQPEAVVELQAERRRRFGRAGSPVEAAVATAAPEQGSGFGGQPLG
jgi:glycosyltransferase involved in cell wall biosynthesis